jgi:hypothetical protein
LKRAHSSRRRAPQHVFRSATPQCRPHQAGYPALAKARGMTAGRSC